MKKSILLFFTFFLGIALASSTIAQTVTDIEFDTVNWVLPENYQILEFEGENALLIDKPGEIFESGSKVYLKDYEFSDGIIEFDFYIPVRQLRLIGFFFRLTTHNEEDRYELFFFRPNLINTLGTVQYMPINNEKVHFSTYADDIYQGTGNIEPNIWHHVKAEVKGPHATVYVNDDEVMTVNNLGRGLSKGTIGVWLGETSPKVYFANFKVTK